MDSIFWIPIGAIVVGLLLGAVLGAKSRSSSAPHGMLVGIFLGVMATFPLWAIGISNT
jgi:F0F1-type ATP synthase assembly protein I